MTKCENKNFSIDASVDKQIQNCFQELVNYEMVKLDSRMSENRKRSITVGLVLVKKRRTQVS